MTNKLVTLRCVNSSGREDVLKTGDLYQGYLGDDGDRWVVPGVLGEIFYLHRFIEEPSMKTSTNMCTPLPNTKMENTTTKFKEGDEVVYTGDAFIIELGDRVGTVVDVDDTSRDCVMYRVDFMHDDSPPYTVYGDSLELHHSPGGMKYDGGKARMALLFDGCPNALEAVGQVLTFGAQKYAAHSWQTVPEGEERYKSALLRHLLAVGRGEETDPESNLHHLAHAACNALFILELELRKQNA